MLQHRQEADVAEWIVYWPWIPMPQVRNSNGAVYFLPASSLNAIMIALKSGIALGVEGLVIPLLGQTQDIYNG